MRSFTPFIQESRSLTNPRVLMPQEWQRVKAALDFARSDDQGRAARSSAVDKPQKKPASRLRTILVVSTCSLLIGFAAGRYTSAKPSSNAQNELSGVSVDCYDKNGNLLSNKYADLGFIPLGCGPGQTARLHQSNPPVTIKP